MKKLIALLLCLGLLCGCATYPSPAITSMNNQLNRLSEQASRKKADIDFRRSEIEEAHKNGKLSEAEYLSLKNQLKQELDNYAASLNQEANEIGRETHERLRDEYGYR